MMMMRFTYPDLPVCAHRREIAAALREHQVVVVVGETGSGKTTQLPKIAMEVAGEREGMLGCTQPRRLAAVAVARRLAEEVGCEVGAYVGYQVRFDDHTGPETRMKLMTDGILLAETQQDPDLLRYHTIILDEAHERSLNIDFLLGFLKLLLARRRDLKLIISSATMDAAAFAEFFGKAPVVYAEGRTYPVEHVYLPRQHEREELSAHVCRALAQLSEYDDRGDVLVFLPGEREIRDCADALEAEEWPHTLILPLFARLSLAEQQRIFHPLPGTRRVVLATNVAETSLTIPGILYVIDSGLARISRYLPGRQIQSLQVEPISQASARQRAGRCGRVAEGICLHLYSEEDLLQRAPYTDPEIRRSSLAGVILRMADLHLPPLAEFPLPDPPSARLINEGYRTLREIGAINSHKELTPIGRKLARLPLDPRLGRILLEAREEQALAEALVIVAGVSIMDPRERPAEYATQADQAHAQWRHEESDFLSLLLLWRDFAAFHEGKRLQRNRLRKWCSANYLSFMRMVEWHNLQQDLANSLKVFLRWRTPPLPPPEQQATAERLHRAILAGAPLQIGTWDREAKLYRSTGGRTFSVFPGSGLFRRKSRAEWVFGMELVETGRLWMRRAAVLDPAWVEQVAPQLCACHAYAPEWNKAAGVVYARERVVCGGLTLVDGRRISYARNHPLEARSIMIRDGILPLQMQARAPFLDHLEEMRERVSLVEHKLRRRDLIWCEDSVYRFFAERLPAECTSEKALRQWREQVEKRRPRFLFIPYEECVYPGEGEAAPELYPDELCAAGQEFPVYYRHAPGEEDDGVTLGVHIDQLEAFPDWLPGWGVPAHLEQRVEILLRSLPKALRSRLLPIAESAAEFVDERADLPPEGPLEQALAEFVHRKTGQFCHVDQLSSCRMPEEFTTKIWVCDDAGRELALGTSAPELRERLTGYRERRFHKQAARTFSASPMTHWDCGDLPLQVEVGSSVGYPALVDEKERVRVKIYPTEAEAAFAHRAGVRRLAMLRCGDYLHSLRKRLPLSGMTAQFACKTLGARPKENAEQSIAAAVDAALAPLPRTLGEFDAACLRLREQVYDTLAGPISRLWALLGEVHQEVREYLATAASLPVARRVVEDVEREWAWLVRPGFLCAGAPEQLADISRFARGLRERLKRLAHQPIARELERLDALEAAVPDTFYAEYALHPDSAAWVAYGFMVAEYRLTLFAPMLALKGRSSARKLQENRP